MLNTKEITKVYKGTKITSRVDLYKTTKRQVKKQSSGAGSNVAKFSILRKFTGCQISQPAKFAGCEFSQPYKFITELSFSSVFFAPNFLWFDHAYSNSARVHRV